MRAAVLHRAPPARAVAAAVEEQPAAAALVQGAGLQLVHVDRLHQLHARCREPVRHEPAGHLAVPDPGHSPTVLRLGRVRGQPHGGGKDTRGSERSPGDRRGPAQEQPPQRVERVRTPRGSARSARSAGGESAASRTSYVASRISHTARNACSPVPAVAHAADTASASTSLSTPTRRDQSSSCGAVAR